VKILSIVTLLSSSLAFAAGGKAPQQIDHSTFSRLKAKGFECTVYQYRKKQNNYDTGIVQENARLRSQDLEGSSMLLNVPQRLKGVVNWHSIPYEELTTLVPGRLVTRSKKDYLDRRIDINFKTGEGTFTVNAKYGGWPIGDRQHDRQWIYLKSCKLR